MNRQSVLVVGGAGYVGSHMCQYLHQNGYTPIVLDNLSAGHREFVQWGPFYQGNSGDSDLVEQVLKRHQPVAVFHFAAFIAVGESVIKPAEYYENNVAQTLQLLKTMVRNQVYNFIFSSTAAIFGGPVTEKISEEHPKNPLNPYGRTKLMVENILEDFDRAYGLKSVCLRYFNAAGADPNGQLGEDHHPETHLIPLVLDAISGRRDSIKVFGTDYPTPDGTCIRDYIHILDLAQAHILGLTYLMKEKQSNQFNLGNGQGFSVKDVIELSQKVAQKTLKVEYVSRREGDAAVLVADSQKAKQVLGWKPQYPDLETIIAHAWQWQGREG